MAAPPKTCCEVCGNARRAILHYHHIIPRCDARCHNGASNLGVLCPNCHSYVHAGDIIILGVYPSTGGRCLVWYRKGEDPPIPQEYWLVKENPLVLTIAGDSDDLGEICQ